MINIYTFLWTRSFKHRLFFDVFLPFFVLLSCRVLSAMDEKTKKEIEKKAKKYEAAKDKIKERIKENVRIAKEKLTIAEEELLKEVEAEFGQNPFNDFLSSEGHTEDGAKKILKKKIPHGFGPDKESFKSLFKEIESLKEWRKKPKPKQLIPKNVAVKEATLDMISISWDAVEGAKNYQVEVDGGKEVFWEPGTSNTFTKAGLSQNTEHTFRVRTIHERVIGEWSEKAAIRTQKLPAPANVNAKSESLDSITLTWDDNLMASFYQIEVDGSSSLERVTKSTFTKRGLLPDTDYTFKVRAVRGGYGSEWSGPVRGKTQHPAPANVRIKSTTHDTITLIWDVVNGASSYHIEVDGSKSPETTTSNTFTKRGLLPDTEHSFRVRAVKGNSVSEWSGTVKGKTPKSITQDEKICKCYWKKCPDYVDQTRKYIINPRNTKAVSKDGDNNYCTIIGNTPLPLNQVASWWIKILNSKKNDGNSVFIGVAPSNINQNVCNYDKYGWYFHCFNSTLHSGPPHKRSVEVYGPWKGNGQYFHTGDVVGVVMDTAKGELSFVVDGANLGVAYERIPIDKPLVPCVLLRYRDDSVELSLSEVKRSANSRRAPFNPDRDSFKTTVWKKCPDGVTWGRRYSVDKNPRVAKKTGDNNYCTIIGSASIPLSKVASWNIKILKSKDNNGSDIYIGVAPSDINQNENDNYKKCGWFFNCYVSSLYSGPPHNCNEKEYGPRKGSGEYVRTGDVVGVVMDTTKGELSFVLNGANLGVAYKGIPIDNPLVPCVILRNKEDSVEIIV